MAQNGDSDSEIPYRNLVNSFVGAYVTKENKPRKCIKNNEYYFNNYLWSTWKTNRNKTENGHQLYYECTRVT